MVEMSYFCRQNVSQISLEIVANCSHPSEILALGRRSRSNTLKPTESLFVSASKTLYPLLSTGSTQDDPSRNDWKIVDCVVKNPTKHTNQIYL